MDLLAAEMTADTGKYPGEHYRELTAEFGAPYYTRIDAPATPDQKAKLQRLSTEAVRFQSQTHLRAIVSEAKGMSAMRWVPEAGARQ